ncbi:MAG: hypothetical protein AAF800_01570 [Planctomycetota bacterium]
MTDVFDARQARRRLEIDTAGRRVLFALSIAAFAALLLFGPGGPPAAVVAAVGVLAVWLALGFAGARTMRELPALGNLLDRDPDAGEARLDELQRQKLLPRWVRLMLLHRLAVLRHRQQRFAESAAIAQTVLTTARPGPAATHRGHLLLLLAEARLELRDLPGAWLALTELYRRPLGLHEALQRLALRTRYELSAGRPDAAVAGIDRKVALAELMPGPQCGALHAMLAAAARDAGRDDWHRALWPRVELLCGAEQLAQMRGSGLI